MHLVKEHKTCAKFDPSGRDGTFFMVTGPRFFTEERFAFNHVTVEAHPSGLSDNMSHMHTGDEHMERCDEHMEGCDEFSCAGNREKSCESRLSSVPDKAVVLEVDQAISRADNQLQY